MITWRTKLTFATKKKIGVSHEKMTKLELCKNNNVGRRQLTGGGVGDAAFAQRD